MYGRNLADAKLKEKVGPIVRGITQARKRTRLIRDRNKLRSELTEADKQKLTEVKHSLLEVVKEIDKVVRDLGSAPWGQPGGSPRGEDI